MKPDSRNNSRVVVSGMSPDPEMNLSGEKLICDANMGGLPISTLDLRVSQVSLFLKCFVKYTYNSFTYL